MEPVSTPFAKQYTERTGVPSVKSSSARSKVLGLPLSPNPVLRSGPILCFSAMPFSMTELSSSEPNGLIHKLLLFQYSLCSCLNFFGLSVMPFIMLSWSHILSAECKFCSRGTQINLLPPVLFLSTVSSCSFSNFISYFNSTFSVYKAALVIQILYSS